ncbi:response regulator receiver domain-containing protein [Gelidibacter algens]|uniref:Response regulator receiver domain-containing protein n=1 Tax=Gelidibacter algens TaxID=49280 RepID=A0A327RTC7_9FLAO|nr:response regulator [Gelidibacter algens]RAJ19765.1 response regulator receiver domain-containing protein [Gelidibacter algens]
MNKNGAIIIVEDDIDDQEMFTEVFKELDYKNKIIFFNDGQEALAYLTAKTSEPFIVFSDINMPKLSGVELRKQIHENEDIRLKTIPYLFFTTSAAQDAVIDAYSKSIQGFFIKPSSFQDLKSTMKTIVEYWQKCESPNYVQ